LQATQAIFGLEFQAKFKDYIARNKGLAEEEPKRMGALLGIGRSDSASVIHANISMHASLQPRIMLSVVEG
jgi:pyruvate dehydrogenase complex dehydrogenase (E1) component